MPWGVILMVTGVTVLVALLQETKGLALITDGIAQRVDAGARSSRSSAFGTGLVSVYSSTSGVVLPAFLPMVPELAERLGGLDPLPIAWSMNVGASLVDLSSLSTVRRAVHRGRGARRRRAQAVQRAAGVGHVDDGGRRGAVLFPVRVTAVRPRARHARRDSRRHPRRLGGHGRRAPAARARAMSRSSRSRSATRRRCAASTC